MIKVLDAKKMGTSDLGWLQSRFHFSFADYYNPDNVNYGVLRVVNDDLIQPQTGFGTHPHKDMEIISYIVQGEITHKDSMGNEETLKEGEVQYLSAGTGITHSEHNLHHTEILRLLQIWILPPQKGVTPLYGSYKYDPKEREGKWLNIVSSLSGDAKVKIHQDIQIYVAKIKSGEDISYTLPSDRQLYFIQVEGEAKVKGENLTHGDAAEIEDENNLHILAQKDSHFLVIEIPKAK